MAAGQPQGVWPGLDVLARVAQSLAGASADVDDRALVTILGQTVVPGLGHVVALFAADAGEHVQLVEAAPAGAEPATRLRAHLERYPDGASVYAEVLRTGCPTSVRSAGADAAGLSAEMAAPLGGGSAGLLTIGTTDAGRQYALADLLVLEVLASLLGARRAARDLALREAASRQRLQETVAAGRELAHRLNNDLTMPVGVVELLLDRTPLSSDLREMLVAASKDLAALEQHIRSFHDQLRHSS
jgi:hypothetical protein